jgi:hypothetical protein
MFWTMIIGAVPTVGNVLCGHLVRSVGAAKEAGFGMSMGGVLNIILDPLFMFVILPPGNEVTGAAIATCLSNTAAFVYFLIYLYRHRNHPVLTMSPADFSVQNGIPGGVISGTALIRPDFPELLTWPFLWQQTEYVLGGGSSHYMFLVLAAMQLYSE